MADVDSTLTLWSTTASSNKPTGATTIGTGLDDNLRTIQSAVVSALYNKGSDIASASTTDLSAAATEGLYHNITGTTTITALGTLPAGAWKILKFAGSLTLTHNATSLILPSGANIITAAGDVALMVSEGSGNWRCIAYTRANAGEYVESVSSTGTAFPATGTWGDLTSISLTAGDWDVTFTSLGSLSGATMTDWRIGISTTSGNSSSGLVTGSNTLQSPAPTASANNSLTIASYRVSLTSTTTVYAKYFATYSAGTPLAYGRLSARRAR